MAAFVFERRRHRPRHGAALLTRRLADATPVAGAYFMPTIAAARQPHDASHTSGLHLMLTLSELADTMLDDG